MVGRIGTLVSWYQMLIFPLATTLASQLQLETLQVSVASFPGPISSVLFSVARSKDWGSLGTRLGYFIIIVTASLSFVVMCGCHKLLLFSVYVQIIMTSSLYVSTMLMSSPKMRVQLLRYVLSWHSLKWISSWYQ